MNRAPPVLPERIVYASGLDIPMLGIVRDGDYVASASRDSVLVVLIGGFLGGDTGSRCGWRRVH
jgi:hypothetical protein